jgi:hypothetical protein
MINTFPSDDILGPATWLERDRAWKFDVVLIEGSSIVGQILPEIEGAIPSEDWLRLIRKCVIWLRANEPELRRRVSEDMFDYWCETYCRAEDEVNTPEEFAATIRTIGINFSEGGQAEVFYDDNGLFGDHGIWVEINEVGEFVQGPDFV